MRNLYYLTVFFAALLNVKALSAADLVIDQPPEPPLIEDVPAKQFWTGPYLGGMLGYRDSTQTATGVKEIEVQVDFQIFETQIATDTRTKSDQRLYGGFFAGYNHQFANNLVASVEVGIDRAQDGDWLGSFGPRAGYAADRLLWFAEGGYAFLHLDIASSGVTTGISDNVQLNGYFAGAGVDIGLTDRVFAGLKYNYFNFSDNNFQVATFNVNYADYELHTIKARNGLKF